ncbi:DUF3455 domain-containing protein [soil metagenome]
MRTSIESLKIAGSAVALLGAVALGGCGGAASDENIGTESSALSSKHAPTLPDPALAVPAGNRLAFRWDAIGVQIYACSAVGAGYGWVFKAPEANLFGRHGHVAGKHYAGPTWEANDGSTVVAAKVAGTTPDATAIPWLLLGAVSHAGDGRMTEITFVQRLETAGGLAPASGCDATSLGSLSRVPYTATYFFSAAQPAPGHHDDGDDDGDDD